MEIAYQSAIKLISKQAKELLKKDLYIFKWDGTSKLTYEAKGKVIASFPVEDFSDFFIVPGKLEHTNSTFIKGIIDEYNKNKCSNELCYGIPILGNYGAISCDNTLRLKIQSYGDVQIINATDDILFSVYEHVLLKLDIFMNKPLGSGAVDYLNIYREEIIPIYNVFPDQYLTTLKDPQGWAFGLSEFNQSSDRIRRVTKSIDGARVDIIHQSWSNILYFFSGDLSCILYNSRCHNMTIIKWSLSNIYNKPFMKSNFSFESIKSLNITKNSLYLSKSETGSTSDVIFYETELDLELAVAVLGNSDMVVRNRVTEGVVYWSLYQTIIDNYVSYATNISYSDLKENNSSQPTITNAKYTINISKVLYICGSENYGITGLFLTEYNKVVKTVNDMSKFGSIFWISLKNKTPECVIGSSIKVFWTFNGKKEIKTFKKNSIINLAVSVPCKGDYGLCVNNNREWQVIMDSYPLTTCKAPKVAYISCEGSADCEGEWTNVTTCEDGEKTSTYMVTTPAKKGGKPCPYKDLEEKTEPCEITDCIGSWGEWSNCVNSTHSRTYTVTSAAKDGGSPCPNKAGDIDTQACTAPPPTSPFDSKNTTTYLIIGVVVAVLILVMFMLMSKPKRSV